VELEKSWSSRLAGAKAIGEPDGCLRLIAVRQLHLSSDCFWLLSATPQRIVDSTSLCETYPALEHELGDGLEG
jgi:hypothetical protein